MLDFAHRRVQPDLGVSGKLCECQSPEAAAEVLRGYYETAFQQCSEEVSILLTMTREIGQGAFGDGLTAGLGDGQAGGSSEKQGSKEGRSG